MLTCACGARFEVEDTLAGQEVLCPECQQPIKAPALARPPQVTSGYALASVVVALVGAFTVVGSLAAVVLGTIALRHIARNRQRVTGTGFAAFGIVLGVLFTGLTVFALSTPELLGLAGWLRERTMSEKIDTSGPLEIVLAAKGFAITRPTEKWGQVVGNRTDDPVVSPLQQDRDLLLIQVARYAFVDVRVERADANLSLDQCQDEVLAEFDTRRPINRANRFEDDEEEGPRLFMRPVLRMSRQLPDKDGAQRRELEVEVRCAGQPWRFLIYLCKRKHGPLYIVRGYVHKRRFDLVKDDLEKSLESFRILPR